MAEAKAALDAVQAEVEAKSVAASELEQAKAALESQLKEAQDALQRNSGAHDESSSALDSLKEEVRMFTRD